MAESSSSGAGEKGLFGKALFRTVNRTKQKVWQNFGKADRTTDNEFDRLVDVFTEQHNTANHLLKELKSFIGQVKAMSVASQSMYQAISSSYETDWKNADKFIPATEELIALWDDYVEKLSNDLQAPLLKYADHFRDVKKKIEKRGRKLTDFDGARHNVESLENAKKRDETKISKAHEEFSATKCVYETIHNELCEELPALYQSRIPTLCSYFGSLFEAEAVFQTECAKIKTQLAELIESETATIARSPAVKTPPRPMIAQRSLEIREQPLQSEVVNQPHDYVTLVELGGNANDNRIASESSEDEDREHDGRKPSGQSPNHSTFSAKKTVSATSSSSGGGGGGGVGCNKDLDAAANPKPFHSSDSSVESNPKMRTDGMSENPLTSSEVSVDGKGSKASIAEERPDKESNGKDADEGGVATENGKVCGAGAEEKRSENVGDHELSSSGDESAVSADHKRSALTKDDFLYKVIAIHNYEAEDMDELSFEKGEVLGVLPFDETSEEPDEGWLLGVKSSTGERGVFPMNFTSKA